MKGDIKYIRTKEGKVVGKLFNGHEWCDIDQVIHEIAQIRKNQKDMHNLWESIHSIQLDIKDMEKPQSFGEFIKGWLRQWLDVSKND